MKHHLFKPTIIILLLLPHFTLSLSYFNDDSEALAFLESLEPTATPPPHPAHTEHEEEESDDDFYNDDDVEDYNDGVDEKYTDDWSSVIDDKDVVVLTDQNFSSFVDDNRFVLVEFYAPWCGHCKALAPEYAAAAKELKKWGEMAVVLAKVDGSVERELAEEYEVEGFPTIFFFEDGEHLSYTGHRTNCGFGVQLSRASDKWTVYTLSHGNPSYLGWKDAIVTWIKKKIGPGVYNISTTEDAERVLTSSNKVVLAFLESLAGPISEELAAASKLTDDVSFYQTVNHDVAKLFFVDRDAKPPTLVLLKREEEKSNFFDGQFDKSAIAEFVSANKLPLVTTFTKESAPTVFESPIKKQLLLFATSKASKKVIPIFQEAAKLFKGKLIFVYIEVDNEEDGRPVAEFFGVTGKSPKVIGYTASDNSKKFIFEGAVTLDNIKVFGENFVQDKLKPFYKSDPIPETNDGDVKVVVGNNFDEVVLDESKDVLLEVYAPGCGHCQNLEPTYNKLAKHLRGIESLVIAKMDGTTNEHPNAKADGFPTLLFFPAGKTNSDPITVDSDHTVVALYKFLKEHASVPFKLQKPTTLNSKGDGAKGVNESRTTDVKDEL